MKVRELMELYNNGWLLSEIKKELGILGEEKEERKIEEIFTILNRNGHLLQGEELKKVREVRRIQIKEQGIKNQEEIRKQKKEDIEKRKREKEAEAREKRNKLESIKKRAIIMQREGADWDTIKKDLQLTDYEKYLVKQELGLKVQDCLEKQKDTKVREQRDGKVKRKIESSTQFVLRQERKRVLQTLGKYRNYIEGDQVKSIDDKTLKEIIKWANYDNSLLAMCLYICERSGKYQEATVVARMMASNEKEKKQPNMEKIRQYQERVKIDTKKSYYQQVDRLDAQGINTEEICKKMQEKLTPYAIKTYLQRKSEKIGKQVKAKESDEAR